MKDRDIKILAIESSCDETAASVVMGIELISVVARINITYSGGSSSVFKRALKAAEESICASSIMYTLYLPLVGL